LDNYDPSGTRTRTGIRFLNALRAAAPETVVLEYRVYADEGHVPFPTVYHGLQWIHSQMRSRRGRAQANDAIDR
jgi:hypothetical protein